jgi:hypothetical protein
MKLTFVFIQTIYVFGFGVPLFIDGGQGTGGKWGLWILHKLVLTGVYGLIVFMHHSRWRDRLPGNRLLFSVVSCIFQILLFSVSWPWDLVVALLQQNQHTTTTYVRCCYWMAYHCLDVSLLQVELDLVYGKHYFQSLWYLIHLQEQYLTMIPFFRLYNLTTVCYHSLYLPLLYATFLADFFQVTSCLWSVTYFFCSASSWACLLVYFCVPCCSEIVFLCWFICVGGGHATRECLLFWNERCWVLWCWLGLIFSYHAVTLYDCSHVNCTLYLFLISVLSVWQKMYVANHGDEWKYVNLTAAYFQLGVIYLAVGWDYYLAMDEKFTSMTSMVENHEVNWAYPIGFYQRVD